MNKLIWFQIIILALCFLLWGVVSVSNAGMDFTGMSGSQPSILRMYLLGKRVQSFSLIPPNNKRARDMIEVKAEGLEVLDDEHLIELWESVFMLLDSEVPKSAATQVDIIINRMILNASSPVGADIRMSSVPLSAEEIKEWRGYDRD